jgi:hypothetical protein
MKRPEKKLDALPREITTRREKQGEIEGLSRMRNGERLEKQRG